MSSSRGSYNAKSFRHEKAKVMDSSTRKRKSVTKKCRCGRNVLIFTAWTPKNYGRDFYRCPLYKNKELTCGLFKWVDEDSSSSEEKDEVLIDLLALNKKRCRELKKENAMYEGELRRLRMITRLLVGVVIILVCLLTVLYCKLK